MFCANVVYFLKWVIVDFAGAHGQDVRFFGDQHFHQGLFIAIGGYAKESESRIGFKAGLENVPVEFLFLRNVNVKGIGERVSHVYLLFRFHLG